MDCRETQTLLTAFHDGELPAAERVRVEEHLRGCAECRALLADLARAGRGGGAGGPIGRPKHGWRRKQPCRLPPAAAGAAMEVGILHYGAMNPGEPAVAD